MTTTRSAVLIASLVAGCSDGCEVEVDELLPLS